MGPRILHPASCILHPASCILHPASCILHRASCILHPASCILHRGNMAVTQLKDGRWVCYYKAPRDDGRPGSRIKKEYFGRGHAAEEKARERHNALNLKKRRPAVSRRGPIFNELARSYLRHKHFSINSVGVLEYKLRANILPFLGHRPAMGLRDRDLDNYVRKRRKDGVKDATIRRELNDIVAILNWSVARTPPLIPSNPVRDYKKPPEDNATIMPPTADETARILAAAGDHLKRAILLSYYLGLRPGAVELLSLYWHHVDWENMTIMVSSAHKGGPERRQVPIHDDLAPAMRKWHIRDNNTQTGPIIHYRGGPILRIKTAWKGALKRAGITRRLRPYDLRHQFVTRALEKSADMKALSEIVGSRPETLMRHYQHVSTALHRKTVAKIPPLEP